MIKTRQLFSLSIVLTLILPNLLFGQDEDKKEDIPEPELVEIQTKDGVLLQCTYFGGTEGKETIPVLMLHDWGATRKSLLDIAVILQKEHGCAVLVPDLRGHGESVNTLGGRKLDPDRWRKVEIASIIADIEACKKYLVEKNNQGQLNIDMLSVVAQGVLCIHALEWSITDWSYGPLGGIEQGQDVKSIVLLNPEKSFRGLNLNKTIKNPLYVGHADFSLSMMVMANSDDGDESVRDVNSIYNSIDRMRKDNDEGKDFLHYFEYRTVKQVPVVERNDRQIELGKVIGFFIENEAERFETDNRWATRDRG